PLYFRLGSLQMAMVFNLSEGTDMTNISILFLIGTAFFITACNNNTGSQNSGSPTQSTESLTVIGLDIDSITLKELHPTTFTMKVVSTQGITNVHVLIGLIEQVAVGATDQEKSALSSCALGTAIFDNITADMPMSVISKFTVHDRCPQLSTDSHYNLFTVVDPHGDIYQTEGWQTAASFVVYNEDDLDLPSNQACLTGDGEMGCIYKVALENSPGIDLSVSELELESELLVLYPTEDHPLLTPGANEFNFPHIQADISIRLDGADPSLENALPGSTEISYDLCPDDGSGGCALDRMPLSIYSVPNEPAGHDRSLPVDSMGSGYDFHFSNDLYVEQDTMTALQEGGAWSGYDTFIVRGCVNIDRGAEAGFDSVSFVALPEISQGNNCLTAKVSLAHPGPAQESTQVPEITPTQEGIVGKSSTEAAFGTQYSYRSTRSSSAGVNFPYIIHVNPTFGDIIVGADNSWWPGIVFIKLANFGKYKLPLSDKLPVVTHTGNSLQGSSSYKFEGYPAFTVTHDYDSYVISYPVSFNQSQTFYGFPGALICDNKYGNPQTFPTLNACPSGTAAPRVFPNLAAPSEGATSVSLTRGMKNTFGSKKSLQLTTNFGTSNSIDFSGAHSRTRAAVDLSGWINTSILDLDAQANALTAITGSNIDLKVAALGTTLFSKGVEIEISDVQLNATWQVSKDVCDKFGYSFSGVGLNVAVCATGSLGFDSSLAINAMHASGTGDLSGATTVGSITPKIEPFIAFDGSAKASVGGSVVSAGIQATIVIAKASVPLEGRIDWGISTDKSQMGIMADANLTFHLESLSGDIKVFAEADAGLWTSGVSATIVKWNGLTYDYTILNRTQNISLIK
ncbi:MAG: hypothetical protein R8M38_07395, partial [Mariprofundaceae bacterium]